MCHCKSFPGVSAYLLKNTTDCDQKKFVLNHNFKLLAEYEL